MDILLNDEEIAQACRNEAVWYPIVSGADRGIAKAQLKKVVDYLWNECYGNPDELGYLRLNGEYWQALLKEVE